MDDYRDPMQDQYDEWCGSWADDPGVTLASKTWENQGDDPILAHLSDQKILGLGDGFDDPRIDTLIGAYITLRRACEEYMPAEYLNHLRGLDG